MSMIPPKSSSAGDGMPIKCYYCREETTTDKVISSPDGKPTCPKCITTEFKSFISYGKDIDSLR